MKFLLINSVCGIRSTGRICTDIADSLASQGHQVKIAYGREDVPEKYQKYAVRIGSDFDVKLHALYSRLMDASGFGSTRATQKFIEWVREYDPDVIHLHNLHGYYINIEILFDYLRTCGKKIVWTLHDCWAFTGHCTYFDVPQCEKWKDGCEKCPIKFDYPKSFTDHSKRNWKSKMNAFVGIPNMIIVVPSKWLAGLVGNSFLKSYPVKVINNGIDTVKFSRSTGGFKERYGIENKRVVLGVAGPWTDRKGYSDFLKLSDKLDDAWQIVMVGVSKKQLEELPKTIIGIQHTDSIEQLAEIYSAADAFVNLTYCDNYPTVNLEAISCGTPVITYNTGGSPESAEVFGRVIEKGDLEAVCSVLEQLPKSVKPHDFSMQAMVKKYVEVLT